MDLVAPGRAGRWTGRRRRCWARASRGRRHDRCRDLGRGGLRHGAGGGHVVARGRHALGRATWGWGRENRAPARRAAARTDVRVTGRSERGAGAGSILLAVPAQALGALLRDHAARWTAARWSPAARASTLQPAIAGRPDRCGLPRGRASGADRPKLCRRYRARPADGADAGLRRSGDWARRCSIACRRRRCGSIARPT